MIARVLLGILIVLALVTSAVLFGLLVQPVAPGPLPAPLPPPAPAPLPAPQPKPKPRPRPCPCPRIVPFGTLTVGGPLAPDGATEVQCDLPMSLRRKNIGGTDGAGLCVWTSIGHAAAYQNERALVGMQDFARKHTGGGWPARVDQFIPEFAQQQGVSTPQYLQYEGRDPSILIAALESGRTASVTYDGRDPHYGPRGRVAHMVNLVYLDNSQACILDNNYVGDDQLVWMSAQEFLDRWIGDGQGWAVILLSPGPPPVPQTVAQTTGLWEGL